MRVAFNRILVLTVALSASLASFSFSAIPQASAASATGAESWVGFTGDAYVGETLTMKEIKDIQAEDNAKAADSSDTLDWLPAATKAVLPAPIRAAPMATAAAVKDMPGGYGLWNPGYRRSDYVYDSNWRGAQEAHCIGTTCTVTDKWESQIHQSVVGGSSKRWQITINYRRVSGRQNPSFKYEYYCGINVNLQHDHQCETGNGADPSSSAYFASGTTLNRYFEYGVANKEYPLINSEVHFEHTIVDTKFRGYDTCVKKTTGTKLCSSSDG